MRTKSTALAVLFAAFGLAQTAPPSTQTQVFDFTNQPTPQNLQEAATILRTVCNIQKLSIDTSAATISVTGTPDELAMTGWILHGLDQPLDSQATAPAQPFLVAGKSDEIIRIFHLANIPKTPQALQEILTVLRTVADVQKIFNYTALTDLVVRGPAAQMAMVEYVVNSLNVTRGSVTASQDFHYQAPGLGDQVVRVFYLTNTATPQAMQDLLATLRTIVDIQKVFNFTALNALTIRGTANEIVASDFVIQSLDLMAAPRNGQSPNIREFQMAANARQSASVIHVFYLKHPVTPKTVQEIQAVLRNVFGLQRLSYDSNLAALIERGSADQIAKADQSLQQVDQPAQIATAP